MGGESFLMGVHPQNEGWVGEGGRVLWNERVSCHEELGEDDPNVENNYS